MLVRVTWVDGTESDFDMTTLRELDDFVAHHMCPEVDIDLMPHEEGIRLLFTEVPDRAPQ